jgi:hypothetical protein
VPASVHLPTDGSELTHPLLCIAGLPPNCNITYGEYSPCVKDCTGSFRLRPSLIVCTPIWEKEACSYNECPREFINRLGMDTEILVWEGSECLHVWPALYTTMYTIALL